MPASWRRFLRFGVPPIESRHHLHLSAEKMPLPPPNRHHDSHVTGPDYKMAPLKERDITGDDA